MSKWRRRCIIEIFDFAVVSHAVPPGDRNGDRRTSIKEVITAVRIALLA